MKRIKVKDIAFIKLYLIKHILLYSEQEGLDRHFE